MGRFFVADARAYLHRNQLAGAGGHERRLSREHLVQQHAERVHIRAVGDAARTTALLGGHVDRRSHERAGLGLGLHRAVLAVLGAELGDSTVPSGDPAVAIVRMAWEVADFARLWSGRFGGSWRVRRVEHSPSSVSAPGGASAAGAG